MQIDAVISVREVNIREGIKDLRLPTERPDAIFVWFVPSTWIFLVLGYSYLSARKILALGTSTTFRM